MSRGNRYPMKQQKLELPRLLGLVTVVADCGCFWVNKMRWQDWNEPPKAKHWKVGWGFGLTHKATGLGTGVRFGSVEAALVAADELLELFPVVETCTDYIRGPDAARFSEMRERWLSTGLAIDRFKECKAP